MLEYDRDIYKNIIYPLLWHTEAFGKGWGINPNIGVFSVGASLA
jgi:hypothetical protein